MRSLRQVAYVEYSWKTPDNFKDVADAFAGDKNVLVAKYDVSNDALSLALARSRVLALLTRVPLCRRAASKTRRRSRPRCRR